MGDAKTDLLQGTLDLIVLRLLRGGRATLVCVARQAWNCF